MMKPSEPSGSAFLKVDPAYMQHWKQLFPQTQLKVGSLTVIPSQLQPLDRAGPASEILRQHSGHLTSSSSSSTSSSSSSACSLSFSGLTPVSVPQISVLGQRPVSDPSSALNGNQGKELCSSGPERTPSFSFTTEDLDYYLYGQQRMEIIPVINHTTDPNN
eukprot:g45105.t1